MTTDVERLLVRLEVSQAKFERQMAKAAGTVNRRTRQIENRFRKMNATVSRSLSGLAGPLAAAFTVKGAKDLIDASTRIDNALKLAGLSGQELADVYDQLFASAQRNAAPIESLVQLYSKAALVQKELGISQAELINFTDKVGVALRVSGKSATASSGALLQLGQALGSTVVRAEEFNSIQEGATPILLAVAAGLEEAGGSVSKLRTLVIDGQVSSQAFFRAFEAGAVVLEEKVSDAVLTFDQRLTKLNNTFISSADRIDTATDAASFFGKSIEDFASDIEAVVAEIQDLVLWVGNLAEAWKVLDFSSLENLSKSAQTAVEVIKSGGTATDQSNFSVKRDRDTTKSAASPTVTTVSLDDFAVPAKAKKPTTRQLDEFQREIAAIRERTAALKVEQSVVGATVEVEERARASHELMNAARQAGIPITAELLGLIDNIASQYAQEADELDKLQTAQEDINDTIREFGDQAKQVFSGILDDVRAGASAIDIMKNAVDRLVQSLSNRLLDGIFDGAFGGGLSSPGGSLLGGLFEFADGGIAARGRPQKLPTFGSGGVSRSAAIFAEAGPEAAVPLPDGRRIPVDLNLSRGSGGGMNVQIINQSRATVEPAGQGRDAQGNPFQRLVVRDAVRSEVPGAFKQIAPAYNQKPALARR